MRRLALEGGAHAAEANEGFERGGAGAADLAEAVVDACEQPSEFRVLYPDDASIVEKIEAVARRVYRASDVFLYPEAERQIAQFTENGLGGLPVCMAKTHLSLSADPDAAQRAARLHASGPRRPRIHGRGLARARCAATSSRCRGSARARPRSTSTSTPMGGPSGCSRGDSGA